jgi:hypothetical protein
VCATDDGIGGPQSIKSRATAFYQNTLQRLNDVTFKKLPSNWKYRSDDISCNVHSVLNDTFNMVWNVYKPSVNPNFSFIPLGRIKIHKLHIMVPIPVIKNSVSSDAGFKAQMPNGHACTKQNLYPQWQSSMRLWTPEQVSNMIARERCMYVANFINAQSEYDDLYAANDVVFDVAAINACAAQLQSLTASRDPQLALLAAQMLEPLAAYMKQNPEN